MDQPTTIMMSREMRERIDRYRRSNQGRIPPMGEAVRALMEDALGRWEAESAQKTIDGNP